ncbi:hypothetical protein E0H73_24015 [Kribbella pittospori]|uniref:Uncharacterized protein n=1 Tax=Kribbella pittospori TaxID=722689 RepID=A0A4R0KHS5_9ACTN|nr:hypothetical protein E0H73_24015 [Kribbella pittospori]
MHTDAGYGAVSGVEWGGGQENSPPKVETQSGWPILDADEPCDGANPMTGRRCVIGYHQGYHRDSTGAKWLDDE